MKRLTRKSNREYYETHIRSVDDNYTYEQFLQDRPYTLHHIYCVEYETKLGRLEDLEEELGCPLEVVFKALKEGVKVNMKFLDTDITDDILRPRLYYSDDFQCYGLPIQSWGYFVKLKDYQKTWWLKGEKNEN